MKYDPTKHHRRSIRLIGYDYTQAGAYFVTIVVQNHECLLSDVVDGEMRINNFGKIVQECWDDLSVHYSNIASTLGQIIGSPKHINELQRP